MNKKADKKEEFRDAKEGGKVTRSRKQRSTFGDTPRNSKKKSFNLNYADEVDKILKNNRISLQDFLNQCVGLFLGVYDSITYRPSEAYNDMWDLALKDAKGEYEIAMKEAKKMLNRGLFVEIRLNKDRLKRKIDELIEESKKGDREGRTYQGCISDLVKEALAIPEIYEKVKMKE